MSDEETSRDSQPSHRGSYTTTPEQARRNTITLIVIFGLVLALILSAIIIPNM